MVDLFYIAPLLVTGPAIVLIMCLAAAAGVLAVRRYVLPHLHLAHEHSEFVGTMVQSVMVLYGLGVALIAVSVWETHDGSANIVSNEATALASLYRDVSCYPAPTAAQLQDTLRRYTDDVIHQAWPLQRQGKIPTGGVKFMDEFQFQLTSFEPRTEGQNLLHGETLRAYNVLIQARRLRLDAVATELSGVLWGVIVIGAVICLFSMSFFRVEDVRVHVILVSLVAAFIGMIIFMILAYDRPFCGDLGVKSESYELVYDHLMKPPAP